MGHLETWLICCSLCCYLMSLLVKLGRNIVIFRPRPRIPNSHHRHAHAKRPKIKKAKKILTRLFRVTVCCQCVKIGSSFFFYWYNFFSRSKPSLSWLHFFFNHLLPTILVKDQFENETLIISCGYTSDKPTPCSIARPDLHWKPTSICNSICGSVVSRTKY